MKTKNNKNQTWNVPNKVFKIFFVFFIVLFIRYAYLSLSPRIYGINMKDFAEKRSSVHKILPALRGTIYDSKENVLALNVNSYTVIAYLDKSRTVDDSSPEHVVDINMTAEKLGPVLNIDVEKLKEMLSKPYYQVELGSNARGITELKKEEIQALKLPGISFIESQKRYYPNGDFASYIVGYAKNDEEGSILGELGIEANYNDSLKGTDGNITYQRDRNGYKIPGTNETRNDPVNGNNIYLTIDADIQRFIESAVKETSSKYNPKWMMVAAMEAKTGKILGFTTSPSFNPNERNITDYENSLVSYLYEPGSTMKTYTYMCAMENGTYKGDNTFASGSYTIGPDKVSDWNKDGWGTITYDQGLEYSSNVGIANIVESQLNKGKLLDCFKEYGFGSKTGLEMSREQAGDLKFNYPIEIVNAGFGQGINTTVVQHLQALTIIANNGKMVKPSIIEKIVNPNTEKVEYKWELKTSEPLVSEQTVTKIKELMYNTVYNNDAGTAGKPYKLDEVTLIGKTGTAEIFDNKLKRYLTGTSNYIFSFAGMFPYNDPEIIIYATLQQPEGGTTRTLASATTEIVKNIAKYKGMYGTVNQDKINDYTVKSYLNKTVESVTKELNDNNIKYLLIGNGDKIVEQYPTINTTILTNDLIILKTNSPDITIANLTNYSRLKALTYCKFIDIKCEINGYGYVKNQSIKEGNLLNKEETLILDLEEKYNLEENKTTN